MLTVTKFGGSSLSCAAHWQQVKAIITADIARRVVVVSAPGKRHPHDHKLTDLLYLCHAHLRCGVSCGELWRKISNRFISIRDECAIAYPIEEDLDAIYASLTAQTSADFLASRGEYLSAKLMAAFLGYTFVDAKDWLQFDYAGNVLEDASYAALGSLADGRKIVTPGFYGAMPDGRVHTFSRGGSDITGSLAAAALRADVYENWTDVPGVLTADPRIVENPKPAPHLSYAELQLLSSSGAQVLHESAIAPVRARKIALHIRSTFAPELPGTRICCGSSPQDMESVCFAGKRPLCMLRITPNVPLSQGALLKIAAELSARGLSVFHMSNGQDNACFLLGAEGRTDALHAACDALRGEFGRAQVSLRENLSVILALCRAGARLWRIAEAIEASGVPIHHLASTPPGAFFCVNDSQFDTALRVAYAAANG